MRQFDPEDVSASVQTVVDLCEKMERTKSVTDALRASVALSVMKLIIGDKFDELPAFSRWLQTARQIVDEHDKEEKKK